VIGRLSGVLIAKQLPLLMIDVGGVGYEVEAPMSTVYNLPDVGNELVLLTHLVVRDDAHILYGFASEQERTMFRTLIKVNGVGPKMALAILSAMDASDFAHYISNGDTAALTKIPGVGKKTAERLIVEMRDKIESTVKPDEKAKPAKSGKSSVMQRTAVATEALVALGYKPQEASRMVSAVESEDLSSEEMIRAALKNRL